MEQTPQDLQAIINPPFDRPLSSSDVQAMISKAFAGFTIAGDGVSGYGRNWSIDSQGFAQGSGGGGSSGIPALPIYPTFSLSTTGAGLKIKLGYVYSPYLEFTGDATNTPAGMETGDYEATPAATDTCAWIKITFTDAEGGPTTGTITGNEIELGATLPDNTESLLHIPLGTFEVVDEVVRVITGRSGIGNQNVERWRKFWSSELEHNKSYYPV